VHARQFPLQVVIRAVVVACLKAFIARASQALEGSSGNLDQRTYFIASSAAVDVSRHQRVILQNSSLVLGSRPSRQGKHITTAVLSYDAQVVSCSIIAGVRWRQLQASLKCRDIELLCVGELVGGGQRYLVAVPRSNERASSKTTRENAFFTLRFIRIAVLALVNTGGRGESFKHQPENPEGVHDDVPKK